MRDTSSRRRRAASHPVTDREIAELGPIFPALFRALNKAAAQVPGLLKDRALAPRHMRVLILLGLAGRLSVTELSSRLGVTLSTASLLVGELDRAGLIVRNEDPLDRRRTIVDIAPAHREDIATFLVGRVRYGRTALARLEPPERVALIKGLRFLVEALEDAVAHGA